MCNTQVLGDTALQPTARPTTAPSTASSGIHRSAAFLVALPMVIIKMLLT